MRRRRFPLWTLFGVVLVIALVLGSGVLSSTPPTPAQRASAIESVVRCPSCEDLSVAQSTAPTAIAVRAAVVQQIAQGRTDQEIKDYLVARYGPSIVLEPPTSGWSLLVWLLPLAGGAAAVALLVAVLVRRRGAAIGDPEGDGSAQLLAPELVDERRLFLTQSLADADAEYLAGDLSDKDYLALRQRDMVRLAALPTRSAPPGDAGVPTSAPASIATDNRSVVTTGAGHTIVDPGIAAVAVSEQPERRGRRRWLLGGAAAAFGAAIVLAVFMFASSRQPGQSATGSLAQSQAQQMEATLTQAATLENEGSLGKAAQLYQSVLDQHPDNEVALAQLGWLEYKTDPSGRSASLLSDARAKLNKAVQLDPGDYAVRLYLGTVILHQDGNASGAVEQYRQFLADGPPAALVKQASQEIRAAFQKAGQPVPAQVAGG